MHKTILLISFYAKSRTCSFIAFIMYISKNDVESKAMYDSCLLVKRISVGGSVVKR